ncbi:MAG: NYN domain-containing protein [Anaerolineae bacterium]|nr:NYN domain-containing protein [Anaerolineae bacterium]MDW8101949.1 NYN domain-containing protein [Anaerolineae bacterium]
MGEGLVALFIDYENLLRSVQEQFNGPVQWYKILKVAERWGRVVIRRAYADWSAYGQYQKELSALGIELIHVGGRSKNAADIRLTIDAVNLVAAGELPLTHIILATGDSDFTELAHYLHGRGKIVIGLGVRGCSGASLIAACDEFVYYDDLLEETSPQFVRGEREIDRYIRALAPKVRMTANPHRPWVILNFYKLMRQNPGLSLKALEEKLIEHYQARHPEVPLSIVKEVIHQLFHTYCFEFTPPGREGPQWWDRVVSLKEEIHSGGDLLKHCDLGLLRILSRNLGEPIKPSVAAELLYGRGDDLRLLQYIQDLINKLGPH